MNGGLKLILYVGFLTLALVSGYNLKRVLSAPISPTPSAASTNRTGLPGSTQSTTNVVRLSSGGNPTNSLASTNKLTTNSLATASVESSATSSVPSSVDSTSLDIDLSSTGAMHRNHGLGHRKNLGFWIGCALAGIIGLAIMIAYDFSSFTGNRALRLMYNDDKKAIKDSAYEKVETEWAAGNHLEAISLLREYLQKHPREIHAAIRIAEIYEKDLNNLLAAALEYEEVLSHQFTPDRWAWTAIHLCNLYFHLDQEPKAVELLRRIIVEHGTMPAATKARKRLIEMGLPFEDPTSTSESRESASPESTPTTSSLPAGFRPKK